MMKFGRKPAIWLLLLTICVACTGCGTYRWNKPGASDEDFKQDSEECDKTHGTDKASFETCMTGHGWRLD